MGSAVPLRVTDARTSSAARLGPGDPEGGEAMSVTPPAKCPPYTPSYFPPRLSLSIEARADDRPARRG